MPNRGSWLIISLLLLAPLSGCVETGSNVTYLDGAITQGAGSVPAGSPATSPPIPAVMTTRPPLPRTTSMPPATPAVLPSVTPPVETPRSPRFRWGDLIMDPKGSQYIILEGNPLISGNYTAYLIKKCPCVKLIYLEVHDTDARFHKTGTQNPSTICNETILRVLREPWETCDLVEPDTLEGSGRARKTVTFPYQGRFLFAGSYPGPGSFVVKVSDDEGGAARTIFNAAGPYQGLAAVNLEGGKHYVDVQASGYWKITIAQS